MTRPITHIVLLLLTAGLAVSYLPSTVRAAEPYPKPSVYPKSWELDFQHGKPTRIVVQPQGSSVPVAYWYMTYTVTNNSNAEQLFLPTFDMALEDGRVVRDDVKIPKIVFDAIKKREGAKFLETAALIGGQLRLGPDQAKDGVAIWPEPMLRMGRFSIFVTGLSGENATVKGPDDKDVILRKTLQLNYLIRGDEVYPGEDEVNDDSQEWVMR
jgi:hypothetical protein